MSERSKRKWKAVLTVILSVSLFAGSFLTGKESVAAAETGTTGSYSTSSSETGSVTVKYPAPDVTFSLYYVGKADQNGGYILDEPYSEYDVDLNSASAASLLADYVTRDAADNEAIQPVATAATGKTAEINAEGEEYFTAVFEDLPQGVYLLIGEHGFYGDWSYIPQNVLLELPSWEDGELLWSVTVENKYSKIPYDTLPHGESTELKVLKTWKNDDENTRPTSITVQLLCNGQIPEKYLETLEDEAEKSHLLRAIAALKGDDGTNSTEIVLNADNNWTYNWTNLWKRYTWTVVEKEVPEGYTVIRTIDGTSIALTNMGSNPDTPDNPTTPNNPGGGTTKTTKLPQTGQLWWPIPAMIAGGLFLILIGLLLRPKKEL